MHEEIFGQLSFEDMYIKQAFDFYRRCLLSNDNKRLIASSPTTIPTKLQSHTYTGICDRTLGLHIPNGRTLEGGVIRGQLQHCGLLTTKGGDYFVAVLFFRSVMNLVISFQPLAIVMVGFVHGNPLLSSGTNLSWVNLS
jgi:hypothetical protein